MAITHQEVVQACKDAGYGEKLPDDYSDGSPVVVHIGQAPYVMPRWMAEIYGHIGRKEDSNGDNTTTPEG